MCLVVVLVSQMLRPSEGLRDTSSIRMIVHSAVGVVDSSTYSPRTLDRYGVNVQLLYRLWIPQAYNCVFERQNFSD